MAGGLWNSSARGTHHSGPATSCSWSWRSAARCRCWRRGRSSAPPSAASWPVWPSRRHSPANTPWWLSSRSRERERSLQLNVSRTRRRPGRRIRSRRRHRRRGGGGGEGADRDRLPVLAARRGHRVGLQPSLRDPGGARLMRTEVDARLSRAAVGLAEPDVFTEFRRPGQRRRARWRHVPVGPSRRSCREPGVSPRVRQDAEPPGRARLGGSREEYVPTSCGHSARPARQMDRRGVTIPRASSSRTLPVR